MFKSSNKPIAADDSTQSQEHSSRHGWPISTAVYGSREGSCRHPRGICPDWLTDRSKGLWQAPAVDPTQQTDRWQDRRQERRRESRRERNGEWGSLSGLGTLTLLAESLIRIFGTNGTQQICKNIGKTQPKNTRTQQDDKNKSLFPKRISKPNLRREFLPSILGNEKPNKYAKTLAKQHWKTLESNKTPKPKVRSRKGISKTKEEVNFCQAFSGMKNPTSMQKHWQNNTEKHKAATRQQKQKRARKGISKPNLGRWEFLPSILGSEKPNKYAKT